MAATEFLKKSPRIDTVDMALNGVDALRLATRTNPDLVLVEYKMPELDGPETTEALKKLDKPPRVVVLTAHDDGQCEARANESGADAFLLKDEFHDLMPPLVDRLFQTTGRTAFSTTLGDRIRELNRDATIILIDDDLVTLELVNHLLTEVGYRVFRAKNGADGLALVRQHRPELVLLDVGLPDQSGIDVCRQIKADLSLHHTLVMHLSASHTTEADMKKGLAGGADAYFTLPFKKEQLLARVDSLVRIARLERALSSNQGFYDDLFDKSTFGVAYLTPNGTFETVNQMLRTALGFETWQICGKPLADFATKEDRAGIATAISDVQNNGGSVHRGESRFRCTDGREIWARLTIFPQRDGSGQICHLILLFEDITAQKTSSALQEACLNPFPQASRSWTRTAKSSAPTVHGWIIFGIWGGFLPTSARAPTISISASPWISAVNLPDQMWRNESDESFRVKTRDLKLTTPPVTDVRPIGIAPSPHRWEVHAMARS